MITACAKCTKTSDWCCDEQLQVTRARERMKGEQGSGGDSEESGRSHPKRRSKERREEKGMRLRGEGREI